MGRPALRAIVLLVLLGAGYGVWRYISNDSKGEAAEAAVSAVAGAASMAAGWVVDRRSFEIALVHRIVPAQQGAEAWVLGVKTTFQVIGASHVEEFCRLLPRVRDSVNGILNGRVGTEGATASLQRYREPLLKSINRSLGADIVHGIELAATDEFSREVAGCRKDTKKEA